MALSSIQFLSFLFSLVATLPQQQPSTTRTSSSSSSAQTQAAPPPPNGARPTNLTLSGGGGDNDAALVGNCLTQRIDFSDQSRIFNLANLPIPIKDLSDQIDTSRYDLTLDYGTLTFAAGDGASMLIKENSASPKTDPLGTRISTTRFMKYGKITAYFKAAAVPGIVNSFISAGPPLPDPILNGIGKDKLATDTGDEIDIELLGKDPNQGSNNVFYRGLLEFSKHDMYHPVPNGIASLNKWTIEWKRNTITFSLNDKVLRTYNKNGPEANSAFLPGTRFFPDRPQKIQMALWASATNTWSGGLPVWPDGRKEATSTIQALEVTCYDDNDSPVPKFPQTPANVERFASVPGQPTGLVGGGIPSSANKQTKGAIMQPPPAMPAGYTGPANKMVGAVSDSGNNDGKTIVSVNGGSNTASFGKGSAVGAYNYLKQGCMVLVGELLLAAFFVV